GEREYLGNSMNLTARKVKIWFQNHRYQTKHPRLETGTLKYFPLPKHTILSVSRQNNESYHQQYSVLTSRATSYQYIQSSSTCNNNKSPLCDTSYYFILKINFVTIDISLEENIFIR
ncbi:unnamed protein product, partial [Rotaria socialis]